MKICSSCKFEQNDDVKFCSNCGNSEFVAPKKKKPKFLVILSAIIVVIALVCGIFFFFNDKKEEGNNITTKQNEANVSVNVTTTEYEITTSKKEIDFYSNTSDWTGEYGFSDLNKFTYYIDGIYQKIPTEHLGVVSAIEYDCNNDGKNELITISLVPTDDGKLYLLPSIVTNENEIRTGNILTYSNNKVVSECPVFDAGNVDGYKGSFISTRAFISDGKLCILHGMYSTAEIGRGENFDSIYIYDLSSTEIKLYRHYYLYEEEITSNIRSCSIGETITGLSYKLDMNYDINTDDWLSLNTREIKQWKDTVKQAIGDMRKDASTYGFDKHFATDDEFSAYYDTSSACTMVLCNSNVFTDDYFDNNELLFDSWIYCEDGSKYIVETVEDSTNIREKISY